MPNGESELIDENVNAFARAECNKGCKAHQANVTLANIFSKRLKHGEHTMNGLTETCVRIEQKIDACKRWDPKDVYGWMRVAAVFIGIIIVLLQAHQSLQTSTHATKVDRLEKCMEMLMKASAMDAGDVDRIINHERSTAATSKPNPSTEAP